MILGPITFINIKLDSHVKIFEMKKKSMVYKTLTRTSIVLVWKENTIGDYYAIIGGEYVQ